MPSKIRGGTADKHLADMHIPRVSALAKPGGSLGLLTNLTAWWEMDEASGNRADSHTNGLTLTDNNTVLSGTGVGGVGTAADFEEANNEFLSRADEAAVSLNGKDWTIVAWGNLESVGADREIVGKWSSAGTGNEYGINYQHASTKFVAFATPDGASANSVAVTATTFGNVTAGTWYMVAVRYDGTNLGISVNGGAFDNAALSGVFNGTNSFLIGVLRSNVNKWDGLIAKVGLWTSAPGAGGVLTAAQLTALYNAGAGLSYAQLT